MEFFQLIFILISIVGILFFLFANRQFDFFSIAFFSACVYFLPGFFGYALHPPSGIDKIRLPSKLLDETYMVMTVLLIAILIGAVLFDLFSKRTKIKIKIKGSKYVSHITVGLAVLGCIATILTSGHELLSINKGEMMKEISRWHILWIISASLGAIICFVEKKWFSMFICVVLLLIDVFIGFRSSFALTMISFVVVGFSMSGKSMIIFKHKTMMFLSLLGILFLFVYKKIYLFIKLGAWDVVAEKLTNSNTYIDSVVFSEPFITQVILNEVIKNNFKITGEHLVGLLNNLIFFSPSLGLKTESFNSQFQPLLFPEFDAGMANNIWAEMWSVGGWWLLTAFIFVYVCVLFIGSYCLRVSDPVIKGGVAIFFSYWAFYIHRNDFMYQVTLEKRVFLVWFVCVILSAFFFYLFGKKNV